MPSVIEHRGDEWYVIRPDGTVGGTHATRERAMSQQRLLDAQVPVENGTPPTRLEVALPDTAARDAALVASMEAMTQTLGQVVDALAQVVETQNADREALTSALTAAANQPEPVVNVYVPEIILPNQPSPTVNVHVPKTKLLIPAAPTPVVNVTLPGTKKTITVSRNLQGEIESADIVEDLE